MRHTIAILACVGALGCGGLRLNIIDSAFQRPSNVAVYFTVDAATGDPVTGLESEDFRIYEDGTIVSVAESQQTIINPEVAAEHYTLVLVEGHYSMDGDIPDLPRVLDLKKRFGFWLLVDEAHGLGCIGKTGGGMREYYGLSGDEVDIWMGTLSKSLGSTGGYLAGSAAMIDAMKYEAPGSVYSVALAPVLAAAANEAIQIMHAEPERVARLHARGSFFLDVAKSLGLDTGASVGSSITPIMVGSSPLAAAASKVLLEEGINALPIAFPGVPMNQARLRFFITSEHTEDQIRHSLTTTAEILSRLREGPLQDLMKSLSNTF